MALAGTMIIYINSYKMSWLGPFINLYIAHMVHSKEKQPTNGFSGQKLKYFNLFNIMVIQYTIRVVIIYDSREHFY